MDKKIDIEFIAKESGVSRSTVSRVLRGGKHVNVETFKIVQDNIDKCNYKPNAMARALATGSLNIIALVVSDVRNPFYAELVWVISEALRKKGYYIALYNSGYGINETSDFLLGLFNYGFAGIIMGDARNDQNFEKISAQTKCPILMLNKDFDSDDSFDTVRIDNMKGGYIATKHLINLGHKKIAMLRGPKFSHTSGLRYAGYVKALKEYGIEKNKKNISIGDLSISSGEDFAENYIINVPIEKRPTAVFACNDSMAYGIMNVCKNNNIEIPKDISIVGFDDIPMSKTKMIDLTTIRHPYVEIGNLVAEKMVLRILNKNDDIKKLTIVPKLIIRGSTGVLNNN